MGLLGKEGARQVVDLCSSEVQGACRQCGTDGGINGTCLRDTGTHACQPTCVSGPKHRRAERAFTIGRILKSELHTDGHHILTEGGAPITNIGKYTFMPTQHSQGPGGMIRHPVMGFRRALPRVRWCCRGEVADIKLQPRSPPCTFLAGKPRGITHLPSQSHIFVGTLSMHKLRASEQHSETWST